MTADARIGLSHPGGDVAMTSAAQDGGWALLRGDVRREACCRECLTVVERLGNEGPDPVIGVQQGKADC